ncbi:putative disease resistance protein [Citrus sinensis]|uniref:Disease resistance protein n=1 Tax=Citrus sinensis TaxID=2711 RepID=A0ACB8JBB4_CITSI|nr:putative disease resistance protein [Citrus sinensis]
MGGIISTFFSADTIRPILFYVGGQAKYIWGLKGNLDDLLTEKENLIAKKLDLLNKVRLAEQTQPRAQRTSTVKLWFERVDRSVTQVEGLQEERDQEIDRLCLGGFCSKDLISSYDFGKKVEKLKEEVIKLREKGEAMKEVYEGVPEGAAVAIAVDRTIVGQESILDQVWRCITDQKKNNGIIGLYGMGGIGKTTLLKQVNNKFCSEEHDFDVVIWSVVSREPNLKQIQEDIGKRIGFSTDSWQRKSFEERASDITNTLKHKKFVLLLDDIWESEIDLTKLGVPLQTLDSGSRIVFTTRFEGTCGKMGAHKNRYKVFCLGDDDAWKLFEGVVGRYVLNKHPDIPKLAEDVARQCHGLPLALKTVGNAMASKVYPEEWKEAIEILSASASKFEDMEKKVLSSLKFSYDSLPKDELRSCLLYCYLFPEDSEILKTELIEYWKSEGFVDCSSGWGVLGALVRACLLEEAGDRVKMHDMIRDMALWIAKEVEEEENFLVRAGVGLTDAPKIEEWEGVKRISLMQNKIQSLPQIPTCPRLQTLLLASNRIKEITESFFQSLPSLRVLSLRRNRSLTELPVGISSLVSLHHLDMSSTKVRGLPQELKALVNLRYLNLEYTRGMSRIPQQLISSFSKLQVLRMLRCGRRYQPIVEEGNVLSADTESLMKEIHSLEQLNLITLSLHGSRGVENFLKFPKLQNITQALSLEDCNSLPLNLFHLANMEHLEELYIEDSNLEDWNVDCAGEVQKMRKLHSVLIRNCSNVKDLTWLVFVPNLKWLRIVGCDDMEEIISVEKFEKLSEVSEMMGELNLFSELELLVIRNASNLERIYRDPLPFPQLNRISILKCPKLKKVPLNSSSAKGRKIVIAGQKEWWEELQWEDQATQNAFSPCFRPIEE